MHTIFYLFKPCITNGFDDLFLVLSRNIKETVLIIYKKEKKNIKLKKK